VLACADSENGAGGPPKRKRALAPTEGTPRHGVWGGGAPLVAPCFCRGVHPTDANCKGPPDWWRREPDPPVAFLPVADPCGLYLSCAFSGRYRLHEGSVKNKPQQAVFSLTGKPA